MNQDQGYYDPNHIIIEIKKNLELKKIYNESTKFNHIAWDMHHIKKKNEKENIVHLETIYRG